MYNNNDNVYNHNYVANSIMHPPKSKEINIGNVKIKTPKDHPLTKVSGLISDIISYEYDLIKQINRSHNS